MPHHHHDVSAISALFSTSSPRTALDEMSKKGEFVRKEAAWRNFISEEEGSKFPPESGRYHLFVSYACPWAHRTLITRALKGLENDISVTVVHPVWKKTRPDDTQDAHKGWVFGDPNGEPFTNTAGLGGPFPSLFPGSGPDPIFGAFSIRNIYENAGDVDGKYSVPILWDKKQNTIVSNESSEIIRMFNSQFNSFSKHPNLDLYPKELKNIIDEVNDWIYPTMNNGVYRCGFATSQEAYDDAIKALTQSFDRIDSILQKQRFLAGDTITEADVRLFVTLLRFDEVYTVYFKTNTRSVANTPSILNYCREIYQMPGVKETCRMDHIKSHYYCSHVDLNKYSIVPNGNDFIALLEEPHNREELFG